jgi:hypothetical protein
MGGLWRRVHRRGCIRLIILGFSSRVDRVDIAGRQHSRGVIGMLVLGMIGKSMVEASDFSLL